ncbi:DUF6545 domain-containing protein [Streptomyces sp. YGL11-2]|uniref:DUF6545 domain-containing protein n=1 Tax=Streptomyces sp. YGL11-2 TaxID=3414028 RepID=UPI003CEB0B6E
MTGFRCPRPSLPANCAHFTACWLTSALHSRHIGQTPKAQSLNLAGGEAYDLPEDISFLLRIAAAYRSPIVHEYGLCSPARITRRDLFLCSLLLP